MDEQNKDEIVNDADSAIADTLVEFQKKYEDEKAKREDAEKKVVELTKVIRTMSIKPQTDDDEEKPKSFDDAVSDLFD